MKIWQGYGSEHSERLVMIGHFKTAKDAEEAQKLIDHLTKSLAREIDVGSLKERFPENVKEILRKADCYYFGPTELEQFLYDVQIRVEGKNIVLNTDESEVSAFFKLMFNNGARVEIYSEHDYPDAQTETAG